MAEKPNHRCPQCGYEMWVGPLKVTPGIEATFIAFCPIDRYEMVRMDPLGELEAEAGAGSKTFEEFCEGENVLGVIKAEVPE